MAEDELALRRQADRAAKAQAILDNDMIVEAFEELRRLYYEAWIATNARDTDGRERAWLAMTVLTKVWDQFQTMIIDGKVASITLADIEEKRKRRAPA